MLQDYNCWKHLSTGTKNYGKPANKTTNLIQKKNKDRRQRFNNCLCSGQSNLNRNSAVCNGKTLDELKVYGHEQAHHTKRIYGSNEK